MAIAGLARTYDQSTAAREDLEDTIAMISPTDTPLFALMNRAPVSNIKHEWLEDALRGMNDTLSAAMASDGGSVTMFVNNGAARWPIASNFPILLRIDEEIMLATARTGSNVTVTRDYNSTGTAAHSSSARVEIISDKGLEGADARSAFAQTRTRPYNASEIFDATIQVSGSEQATILAGISGTEADYQAEQRLKEMKIQLEKAIITGTLVDGTTTTYRSMGGLWHFISTNKANAVGAAITGDDIEADARACFDAGGNPSVIMCNSYLAERITHIYNDRIRSEPETILGGAQIQRIRLPVAGMGELAIIVNRWCPPYEYYILSMDKIFLGRFRPFFFQDLALTGDAVKSQIIGEYTLIVKNEKAHARRYGLALS